ncbi:MAG: alpha-amylase family glycosyl hydrolase [Candidatus Promineifilaceae bacterium]
MSENLLWWQKGIIYQIYPRSFQDSNGDGIGDLPGITKRLDYLAGLGIDAIWISPIYPSPMADFGYDVADYRDIHPMFGSLKDFDHLLKEAHKRNLKLILDLVPNHTSNEHAWFRESRSSRDNPKRDWYIWRDPVPDGGPPNNWLSFFGGPAWTLDKLTGQYYLHQFVSEQPELNYRHPQVLPAMMDNMRFWLDKGVDGFRVDVIGLMMKDEELRDEPLDPDWDGINPHRSLQHIYTQNLSGVHDLIREMRGVLDEYDDRVMVGEVYLPNEMLMVYYGSEADECHLPFNFQLILMPWQAETVRQAVDAYEAALPDDAWPNWVLGNHDQHRVATRIGRDQARVAMLMLLTLRGTPTTYYGEEIGMENVTIPAEYVQDPPAVLQPEIAHLIGRDPVRTPMQWDDSANAGFTDPRVKPWLPIAEDYQEVNVAKEQEDPKSTLNLYRLLAHLRRAEPALHGGAYASLDSGNPDIFAYLRRHAESDSFLIALNFGDEHQEVDLGEVVGTPTIAISSNMDRAGRVELSSLHLAPNEGLVLRLVY